jgi:predicted phosphodiesterase
VLADVERAQPDLIVFGGDVAWGPLPAATIERLQELGGRARYVMGNTDREMVQAFDAHAAEARPAGDADLIERWTHWSATQISRAQRDFLAGFEAAVTVEIDGLGRVLFCHGSPRDDTEIITSVTPDERLAPMLADVSENTVVCGHTHHQFDRPLAGRRVINAGSVGLPYEGDAAAFWLLLGPDVRHCRTAYDVPAAVATLSAGGCPELDEMLKESLLDPLPADTVAQMFEQQASS